MSILGGLMQGGGYALQAKPKTYDAYGLAAAKFGADEGKKKSKEDEQFKKQISGLLNMSGSGVLPHQKSMYGDRFSKAVLDATTLQEQGDYAGASRALLDARNDLQSITANYKAVAKIIQDEKIVADGELLSTILTDGDDASVRKRVKDFGWASGITFNEETGQYAFKEVPRVNIVTSVNALIKDKFDEYERKRVSGVDILEKTISPQEQQQIAGMVAGMEGVQAEYVVKLLKQYEKDNVDVNSLPREYINKQAYENAYNDILDITDRTISSQIGKGSTTNIYNIPQEVQSILESGGGTLDTPLGKITYNTSVNLGDQSFTAGAEDNIIDQSGVTIGSRKNRKYEAGTTYPVFVFNRTLSKNDVTKINEGYEGLTEQEKRTIAPITKQLLSMDAEQIKNISKAMVNEEQAKVINKILPNSVSAGLATAVTFDQNKSGYVVNRTKSQIEAYIANAKKESKFVDVIKTLDKELERMNQSIGLQATTPSVNPPTGGSGGAKTNWSEKYKIKGIK